jgi:predicted glycogen debranching enzyme
MNPPGGRILLLAKLEETLLIGDRRVDLSTNEYAGGIHPRGYEYVTSFRSTPFPTFTFEAEGVKVEKVLFMPHGSNATQIEYRVLECPAGVQLRLEVRPLIAFRDYHATTHENPFLDSSVEITDALASMQPYPGSPRLYLAHNAQAALREGYWYRNFVYRIERERGLDFQEDLFNPLVLLYDLSQRRPAIVIASTQSYHIGNADKLRKGEQRRRETVCAGSPNDDPLVATLTSAADQFLARRGDDWTIIAGYPWFTDWGRDTMIALPGLTLFTGREAIAKSILSNFARHIDMGMIPNRFLDSNDASEFNNVDGTLWFFEAARAYADKTGDYSFLAELYPLFEKIIYFHIKGTRYNIKMTENALLHSGSRGVQLTWMDAKIGDWVVTPRSGKPVEIQALWYNALKIMEDLARRLGEEAQQRKYSTLSSLALWAFNRIFWNKEKNCLYDVVNGSPDASIRPNQILAVSLHYSMLSLDRARAVVKRVEEELLTPVGLRTLAPSDPNYHGRYSGGPASRDSAYHRGTVWPWLLGPYLTAYIRVHGGTTEARRRARELLRGLEDHLGRACTGQISEIFEGDPPHRPCGCFAQAWSVGEVLRVLCQDIAQPSWANSNEKTFGIEGRLMSSGAAS